MSVVTIGTPYCGMEVGCYDWYTVLWYGGGLLLLVHRIVVRRWVIAIGPPYCDTISEPQYGGPIVSTHLRTTIRCTNRNNPLPNHNTMYPSEQPTSEPQYGVPIATTRIVVRRWVIAIGTPYCDLEMGCSDLFTVLWFGGGFLRLVHYFVVRRWVVPIGISYCGTEVGCCDWYTVLWF
jgi:hypothetical protein